MTLALATLGELPADGAAWARGAMPAATPLEELEPLGPEIAGAPAFMRNYDMRPALHADDGHVSGAWLRAREPRALDAPLAAAMTDAWAPVAFTALERAVIAPTLDLTIHFRRPLPPAGLAPGGLRARPLLQPPRGRRRLGGGRRAVEPGRRAARRSRASSRSCGSRRREPHGLPRPRLERRRPPREPPGRGRRAARPRRPRPRVLLDLRHGAGRRGARPARVPQRLHPDRDRARAGGAARRLQGGGARARPPGRRRPPRAAADRRRRAPARRRDPSLGAPRRCRTSRSRAAASCSSRCWSWRRTSRCRARPRRRRARAAGCRRRRAAGRAGARPSRVRPCGRAGPCAVLRRGRARCRGRPGGRPTTLCVDPADPDVRQPPRQAFAAAAGRRPHRPRAPSSTTRPLSSAHRIEVVGAGEDATVLGALELGHPGAVVADLRARRRSTWPASATRVCASAATVLLREQRGAPVPRGRRARSRSRARTPARSCDCVLVRTDGGDGAHGRATARSRRATSPITGSATARPPRARTRRSSCATRDRRRARSPTPLDGRAYRIDAILGGAATRSTPRRGCPRGSPLIDAGSPAALAAAEWPEDRDRCRGWPTATATACAERDPGAFEHAAGRAPAPGAATCCSTPAPRPAARGRSPDGFTRERYGAFPFPSAAAGAALGARRDLLRRRAGGERRPRRSGSTSAAPARRSTAGRRRSRSPGCSAATAPTRTPGALEATFLDPAGAPIGTVALAAPDRGGARERDDAAAAHAHGRGPARSRARST